MHLYAEEGQTCKLSGSGGHIIDQVQENLDSGRYPLVVTEGSRENKQSRIAVSPYLSHCYNRLERLNGTLFIHGASRTYLTPSATAASKRYSSARSATNPTTET